MEDKANIRLTASEMSSLWTQYVNDSLAVCVNTYFLEKVEDEEVRPVIEWTLNTAKDKLKQGTYIRPPFISNPDKVDFVEKQHFLNGFFGKKRSITSVEISHLFLNIQTNSVGKALITGFAQTAQNDEVKQFLLRGKKLSQKYVETFSDFLIKEDLPAPSGWDSAVSDTTTSVFSDKLIMFHTLAMIQAGIGNFGVAIAASPRRDLELKYTSLIPEISLYAEDGANIMIKHSWMEEPPQADNRDQLI